MVFLIQTFENNGHVYCYFFFFNILVYMYIIYFKTRYLNLMTYNVKKYMANLFGLGIGLGMIVLSTHFMYDRIRLC